MIPLAGACFLGANPALARALRLKSDQRESSTGDSLYHFDGFNERVQAYIVARYHARLTETFGEKGRNAFLLATRTYAEQRGHRMAQRAIADGQPLTAETYYLYGEWLPTEECIRRGESIKQEILWDEPSYTFRVTRCPWAIQFKEMGMLKAGLDYCKDLDASIYRGFNPAIAYETRQTMHDHDCCIQCAPGTKFSAEVLKTPKCKSSFRTFEYHCAHSYWTFRQVISSVFGDKGRNLSEDVLKDLENDFGSPFVTALNKYKNVDFNDATTI